MTRSGLNINHPSVNTFKQCEKQHCGKDDKGFFRPATWEVAFLHKDALRIEDDSTMEVCDTCVRIYEGTKQTRTLIILGVKPLQSH